MNLATALGKQHLTVTLGIAGALLLGAVVMAGWATDALFVERRGAVGGARSRPIDPVFGNNRSKKLTGKPIGHGMAARSPHGWRSVVP